MDGKEHDKKEDLLEEAALSYFCKEGERVASFSAGPGRGILQEPKAPTTKARHHDEATDWRRSVLARLDCESRQGRG